MATIAEILEGYVTLEVECVDRLYLNGYIPSLATAGGLTVFPREHLNKPIPSPAVLGSYTHLCFQPVGRQEVARRRKPREMRSFYPPKAPPGAASLQQRLIAQGKRVRNAVEAGAFDRFLPPLTGLQRNGNTLFPGAYATGLLPAALRAEGRDVCKRVGVSPREGRSNQFQSPEGAKADHRSETLPSHRLGSGSVWGLPTWG